jgi:hypothetical protein
VSEFESRLSALESAVRAIHARHAAEEAAGNAVLRKMRRIAESKETPPALAEILARAGLD